MLSVAVPLMLLIGLCVVPAAAEVPARGAAASAPSWAPSDPAAGERVEVRGRLPRGWIGRKARVQLRTGSSWRNVGAGKVGARGRYAISVSAPDRQRMLRVVSTAVGRRVVSPSRRIVPTAQRVRTSLNGTGVLNQPRGLVATVLPRREGRQLLLQRSDSSGWSTVLRATTDARGRAPLPIPSSVTGVTTWRVRARPHDGAAGVRSDDVTVRTRGLRGVVRVGTVTDGARRVHVKAEDPVDEVEVFIDGLSAGAAEQDGDTDTWQLDVPIADLTTGEHWVTARLVADESRGFAAADRLVVAAQPDEPSGLPDGFEQQVMAAGLNLPTTFELVAPTRVLVAEKAGRVWLVEDGIRQSQPVIDLSGQVETSQDRGLIGMTVDPAFDGEELTGWIYVAYVVNDTTAGADSYRMPQQIRRFRMTSGVVTGAGQRILGTDRVSQCPQADTPDCLPLLGFGHTIGDLGFGPDGALYAAVGDGVNYWGDMQENIRAQQLDVLAGKILRLDPETGLGLPDNPFYDDGDVASRNRSRVFASGFRNPFRFTWDDDQMYAGDVGSAYVEELDSVSAGDNHGWPCFEGRDRGWQDSPRPDCQQLYDDLDTGTAEVAWPLHSYPHRQLLGSVTAGVEVPETWPEAYQERFIYADYSFEEIRTVDLSATSPGETESVFARGPAAGAPVKFAAADDGAVWYLSIFPGELRRIAPGQARPCAPGELYAEWYLETDGSGPPTETSCRADLGLDDPPPTVAGEDYFVRWTAREETGPGRLDVSARAPGRLRVAVDGSQVIGAWNDHPVDRDGSADVLAGLHTIEVEHLHREGQDAPVVTWGLHGHAPEVSIELPGEGAWIEPETAMDYRVRARDDEDGDLSSSVRLDVELMHHGDGDFHVHPYSEMTGAAGSVVLSPDHAPGMSVFRVTALATDSSGRQTRSAPVYACLAGNRVGICR